jgi:hypothetical protein
MPIDELMDVRTLTHIAEAMEYAQNKDHADEMQAKQKTK